ncbi:SDR family oxidoreductase [Peribacillus deserti]|uniref:Nmra-like family protein n=1 Tax=Peribacillus deserti TaxID=673318 RepID=A0A2N5MB93_9BACI|nr:NAD(P)H-binding protein [Peribacillus deserti]PLT31621.1 nmra-like family protein [Peribacillus deserti]
MKILVTGGTGTLGSSFLKQSVKQNLDVRIASRHQPQTFTAEWTELDLESGRGLQNTISDVDVVLHAATSPLKNSRAVDVEGTRRLIKACKDYEIKHLIFPSIVGIESMPMAYYQSKLEAERLIKVSGLPYTILRATQFHSFIDQLFRALTKFPLSVLPAPLRCQSVDVDEVASFLVKVCQSPPQGHVDDFGGPEILTFKEMYAIWKQYRQPKSLLLPVSYVPNSLFKAIKDGKNTNGEQKRGMVTWEQWVKESC